MINIALRTEYSFKKTLGKIEEVIGYCKGQKYAGIADINNTFGHAKFEKICRQENIKPIFGVRLEVVEDKYLKTRSHYGPQFIFIAKTQKGLEILYNLVQLAYDNFYYKAMLPYSYLNSFSNDDVIAISSRPYDTDDVDYIALTPSTNKIILQIKEKPFVFINDNSYCDPSQRQTYELLAGARKHGDGFRFMFSNQTYQRHILKDYEFERLYPEFYIDAIKNTYDIAEQCNVEIPSAPMVKFHSEFDIKKECFSFANKKNINLEEGQYSERFYEELSIIKQKDFEDYFMIVAEMVRKAKKKMLVGPARGSAAGSLICYLLQITTVDPIKHNLLFERFIDINRDDLPDIDVDFPDTKRESVIKDLFKTYGKENVYHISNINRLKSKSALDEFGMSLSIPKYKIENVKDSLIERVLGDDRLDVVLGDTLETTDVGKQFVKEYPKINLVKKVEGHATHAGKHAAGIIVCNDNLTKYCGVNSRENTVMLDKYESEWKNLLKIDCLGLRTLSILQEAAELCGLDKLFYYDLDINDQAAFDIFNNMRLNGIFQFEGQSMQGLCKKMGIQCFDDIVSITALARPGPLKSGAAATYAKRRIGEESIDYICDHEHYVDQTSGTMGVIVFQEQLMKICQNLGSMTNKDVSQIRRAASKTLGAEYFEKYKKTFVAGALENGVNSFKSEQVWDNMIKFGSWGMNLSHAVSYGYISYWCAYMKAHHPLEFTVANLNNTRNESSALKILRDAYEVDKIEYIPVDPDESDIFWSVKNGKMIGGLTNIKGIAEKKAKEIIHKRTNGIKFSPSIFEKLLHPETPYDILYPTDHYCGQLYKKPEKYGLNKAPDFIKSIDIDEDGEYTIIGKVIKKELRDLNEYNEVVKRQGKLLSGDSLELKLILEDDTDQIMCKIDRYSFNRLKGHYLSEEIKEDKTWLIVKGDISKGWKILKINSIFDLKNLDLREDDNE